MSRAEGSSGARGRVGLALILLLGVVNIGGAIAKFARVPFMVGPLETFGFAGLVPLIATLELASSLLLLFAPTRRIGFFLLSAFMGGAIATHLQHDRFPHVLAPSLDLSLLWLGIWLRHPELVLGGERTMAGSGSSRAGEAAPAQAGVARA